MYLIKMDLHARKDSYHCNGNGIFLIYWIFLGLFSVFQVGEHTGHGCYAGD